MPKFSLAPGLDQEANEGELNVSPIVIKKPWKRDLQIKLGRFGHTSVWSEEEQSIYVFAGQQQREGGQAGTVRDF